MELAIDTALALAGRGWRVFPVGENKRPLVKNWPTEAKSESQSVRKAFESRRCAVGVVCGRQGGIFVVDVDSHDEGHPIHERMPETLIVRTPSGGFHYYFAMPDSTDDDDVLRNTQKAEACLGYRDVDTRGEGGYVVGFGSVISSGRYDLIHDAPLAPIPAWVLEAMRRYKRPTAMVARMQERAILSSSISRSDAIDRARQYVDRMDAAVSGSGGHDATMRVARVATNGFGLSFGEAMVIMREFSARCSPPWSEKELAHKVRQAMSTADPAGRAKGHLLEDADPFHGAPIVVIEDNAPVVSIEPSEIVDEVRAEIVVGSDRSVTNNRRSFVTLPAPDDKEQTRLLERVMALGGLCSSFPRWVLDSSEYRQPGLTLGATCALGAALGQRRWTYHRATSSSYVVNVAPTASGKGRPQGAVSQVLREHWPEVAGANDLSSTVSTIGRIESATGAGVGLLLVLDEYGPRLRALFDARSGHQRDMRALLLALSTIGTGAYVASTSATRGGQDRVIRAPGLSILGSSTPSALHEALGQASLDDGFMGRHLFFEAQSTLPMRQRAVGAETIPRGIRDAVLACREAHLTWWRAKPEQGDAARGDELALYAPDVVADMGGLEFLGQYGEHCDERRRNWTDGDVPAALLGRSAEHAYRIALGLAVLRCHWPDHPSVDEETAEVAIAISEASAWVIARSLRDHRTPAWDDTAGQVAAVEAAILACAGDDGWATRTDVLRACRRLRAQDVDAACARLRDEERLETQKRVGKGAGRFALLLRLV